MEGSRRVFGVPASVPCLIGSSLAICLVGFVYFLVVCELIQRIRGTRDRRGAPAITECLKRLWFCPNIRRQSRHNHRASVARSQGDTPSRGGSHIWHCKWCRVPVVEFGIPFDLLPVEMKRIYDALTQASERYERCRRRRLMVHISRHIAKFQ